MLGPLKLPNQAPGQFTDFVQNYIILMEYNRFLPLANFSHLNGSVANSRDPKFTLNDFFHIPPYKQ